MRRFYEVLAVLAVAATVSLPAWAHDVKDPICRMMVDSDTTKFRHKLGSKTFYFCSKQCETNFARSPEKYETLAAQLDTADARDYAVTLQTAPARPIAGRPVEMVLAIRYADSKELVRDYEVIHERLLHLLMVSEDLSWFEHQHPVRGEDGLFRLTWAFPRPGRFRLYADFTPADGDNQVKPLPLTVSGGAARTVPLRPDLRLTKRIGDYRVDLRVRPSSLRMEQAALLTYTLRDRRGRPVRDMQPFIGATGHLIAISKNGSEVVHTHALNATGSSTMAREVSSGETAGHLLVTPEMVTEKGPTFSFKLTLPTGGLYKTWAQFMHDNRVITVPFAFQVADLWEESAAASDSRGTAAKTATAKPSAAGGAQRVTVVIDGGYHPATVTVKPGRPVQLTLVRKESRGCGDVVQFPSLGLKRTLKTGEKAVVTFTPKKPGKVAFMCGMGMYRGEVVVK